MRLGAQGKAEQWLGGAERRLGGSEWRLDRAGEAAELCGAAELLGVPLTSTLRHEELISKCKNSPQVSIYHASYASCLLFDLSRTQQLEVSRDNDIH